MRFNWSEKYKHISASKTQNGLVLRSSEEGRKEYGLGGVWKSLEQPALPWLTVLRLKGREEAGQVVMGEDVCHISDFSS